MGRNRSQERGQGVGLVTAQLEEGPEDLDSCGQQSAARPALQKCGRVCSSLSENTRGEGTWHRRVRTAGPSGVEDHDRGRGPMGRRGPEQALRVGLEGPLGRAEGLGFTNENKP